MQCLVSIFIHLSPPCVYYYMFTTGDNNYYNKTFISNDFL